jgi:diguanylate cyclase (GGDEF)-like protein
MPAVQQWWVPFGLVLCSLVWLFLKYARQKSDKRKVVLDRPQRAYCGWVPALSEDMQQNKKTAETSVHPKQGGVSFLERVTPLARQINCLDMGRIADVCVSEIPDLLEVRFASLYVLDEANSMLHLLRHNHPFPINKIVSINQNPPSPMVMAVRTKELILISNIDTHQKPVIRKSQRAFAENYKTNNCVIAPLICQERVIGVLNLADKVRGTSFQSADIALIELFSQLVGASIGNIKLFEKTQRQATTDGLTGFVNHKTFYEILERELWRSRRYGGPISLIMVDIDNLKKINDTYGHRAGDKVIREISRRVKGCIRQIDTAARYGGDEFAVVLPNTSLSDAVVVAERMVEVVAQSPTTWQREEIPLSISVGLGQYDADTNPEDVTSRSDQALYSAKQAGKNTFRIFEPSRP